MASIQENCRRDQITIMLDLLSNIHEPKRLTHILYSSNMSYSQLVKYMESLKGYGFIKEQTQPFRSYLITGEGQEFVNLMKKTSLESD
jgi:predicted transcriptional regulator